MRRVTKGMVPILLCVLLTGVANATLLIHEDFEAMAYGARPKDQAANVGLGIAAWWDNNGCYADVTNSVAFGSYLTGSQAVNCGLSSSNVRLDFNRDAAIVIGPSLYTSFVFQGIAPAVPNSTFRMQWSVETSGYLKTLVLTNAGGIGTSLDGVTYGYDDSNTLMGKGAFLIVSKFDGIGTASGYSKIWAISPVAYDSIVGGGITEAELDAVATLKATSATIDASAVQWSNASLDYRFHIATAGSEAILDEVKMGTTLEDVVNTSLTTKAYGPTPSNTEKNVATDATLKWYNPTAYAASKYVLNFRSGDPNWLNPAFPTVVSPVVDLDLDGDPATTEATMPLVLENLKTYYWRVISTDPNTSGTPVDYAGSTWSFTTITAAPEIQTQPVTQRVLPGETATFTIGASSTTPLTYRWYASADNVADGGDTLLLSGINEAALNVPVNADVAAAILMPPYYYCVLDNGSALLTSNIVTLTVKRKIAHYTFDGNADDSAAMPHNGTWATLAQEQYDTGLIGSGAAVFTGDPNSYIILGSGLDTAPSANPAIDGANQGSTSYWFKSTSTAEMAIMGSYNTLDNTNFQVNLNKAFLGRISTYVGGGSRIWTKYLLEPAYHLDGQWHLVTATWDSSIPEGIVYLDGMELGHSDDDGKVTLTPFENPMLIGAQNNKGVVDLYFVGQLDDLKLYNYALSKTDVAGMYLAGFPDAKLCILPYASAFDIANADTELVVGDPGFVGDCSVDLFDFVALAANWLDCGIYGGANCQ